MIRQCLGERHKGGVNGEIELIKELIKASRTKRGSARSDLDGKMVTEYDWHNRGFISKCVYF